MRAHKHTYAHTRSQSDERIHWYVREFTCARACAHTKAKHNDDGRWLRWRCCRCCWRSLFTVYQNNEHKDVSAKNTFISCNDVYLSVFTAQQRTHTLAQLAFQPYKWVPSRRRCVLVDRAVDRLRLLLLSGFLLPIRFLYRVGPHEIRNTFQLRVNRTAHQNTDECTADPACTYLRASTMRYERSGNLKLNYVFKFFSFSRKTTERDVKETWRKEAASNGASWMNAKNWMRLIERACVCVFMCSPVCSYRPTKFAHDLQFVVNTFRRLFIFFFSFLLERKKKMFWTVFRAFRRRENWRIRNESRRKHAQDRILCEITLARASHNDRSDRSWAMVRRAQIDVVGCATARMAFHFRSLQPRQRLQIAHCFCFLSRIRFFFHFGDVFQKTDTVRRRINMAAHTSATSSTR